MFPFLIHSLLTLFLEERVANAILLLSPFVIILIWLWSRYIAEQEHEDAPTTLPESSLLIPYPFFRSRFDFFARALELTGQPIYQFNLLQVRSPNHTSLTALIDRTTFQHKLVVISGIARREFFTERSFDLNAGFKNISGAVCSSLLLTHDIVDAILNDRFPCYLVSHLTWEANGLLLFIGGSPACRIKRDWQDVRPIS